MANFQIPENPGYAEEIRKFETTDPAHADLFNAVVQQLLENDAHLKKGKQDAIAIDSALSATSTNPVQNKAVKAALDGKSGTGHSHPTATTTSSGYMSYADKRKMDGIDANANAYTHPSTHPATMIIQDATHRFVSDAEKQAWDGKPSIYYLDAHYVSDYISYVFGVFSGAGWKKIAECQLDYIMENSCVINIQRYYSNVNNEYHRIQLLNTCSSYTFAPIADKSNTQLITKARLVQGAGGKCYIEVYYNSSTDNAAVVSVENMVARNASWKAMGAVADTEKPAAGSVAAVYNIPANFDTTMLIKNDYLASHFVQDYIAQKGIILGSVGWKKIAELPSASTSMASCIIDIKREYMTAEEEYHRFSLCAMYGSRNCEFNPILDKTRHHLITKARIVTGASGKCYLEVYYNYTNSNHINVTIEGAASTEYNGNDVKWKLIEPIADAETPSAGTVAAVYDIPAQFSTTMLAKADGSNVDGVWENLTAGATLGKFDNNGDLGRKPPSYIGAGRAKLRMMRGFKGLSDAPNYMDCLLMNAYSDSTQKYATALGIVKASGIPRAYIAVGDSNNASTWESQAELVTDKNIGSMTAGKAKALETGGVGDRGTPIYIGADGTPNECNGYFAKMEGRFSGSFQSTSYQRVLDLWMHESDRQGVISMGGSKYGVLLRVVGDSRYGGFLEDIFLVFQYGSSFISGDYSKNIIIGVGGISVGELYLSAGSSDCGTTTVEVRMKVSGGAQFTVNGIYIIHL